MKLPVAPLILALSILESATALSDEQKLDRETFSMNNLQNEMTVCANYFLLLERCVGNTPGTGDTATKYGEVANTMIMRALEVGQTIGMTQDAMQSRMKMEGNALMALIEGKCVNISSVMTRHMARCEIIFNQPSVILEEYRRKYAR